jgi:hypothetical protein
MEETPLDSMPAPNLIPQGGGAFVGSIPSAPDPAPPIKLILFTRARREDAFPKLDTTWRWSFYRIHTMGGLIPLLLKINIIYKSMKRGCLPKT